jgi:G3E family GTPase
MSKSMDSLETNGIPLTVLGGFLGSGKTTLLNRLLRDERLADTAVIVNEFGEIGIDHALVEAGTDDMVLMKSGCVCCTLRGDFVDTVAALNRRVAAGEIPPFRRIVLETTGLADPAPVVQAIAGDPSLDGAIVLNGVVVTVDALNGRAQIAEFDEARQQVALADLVIVTKTDLADPEEVEELVSLVHDINGLARIEYVTSATVDAGILLDLGLGAADLAGDAGDGTTHGHDHRHDGEHHHHVHAHSHADPQDPDGITTCTLIDTRAVAWTDVRDWLEAIASLRGDAMLRVKGFIHTREHAGPVVVHGVRGVFYPPEVKASWHEGDERTRLVFITRGIPLGALEASWRMMTGADAPDGAPRR